MATNHQPVKIGPFPLGMTNRREAYALGAGDAGDMLRDAVNVDVSTQGTLRRRAGYQQIVSSKRCHSLWAPRHAGFALYVDGTDLMRLAEDGSTSVVAAGAMLPEERVSFADVHGAVFWSNGVSKGSLFTAGTSVSPWGNTQTIWQGRVLDPMPAGRPLCFHGNRLYAARGDTLFISEPFAPHLYDPAAGFEKFPAPIVMVAATEGGVYIGADVTYFAPGGFPAQELRVVSHDPPLEWSSSYDSEADSVYWVSAQGLLRGNQVGEVTALQKEHIAVSRAQTGASVQIEENGLRRVLAVLHDPQSTKAQARSFIDARLIRRAVP